ncbi:MAG: hypothetical protein EXR62_06150 [Chloroflexi bacterium]|nr:hypothetical protein [Chloroflexota bacterium]
MGVVRQIGKGLVLILLGVTLASLVLLNRSTRVGAAVQGEIQVESATASAPLLHYQGRLLDPASGNPKLDGSYTMLFGLYAVASGGAVLWTETQSVAVNNGLFSVLLGGTTVLNQAHFDGRSLWLGVTVGSDPEAAPRQRLAYVAYALRANDAGTLNGQQASDFAPAGHTHTGVDIVDGSLVTEDLADSAVSTAKIADGAVTPSKLASGVLPKFISFNPYTGYLDGTAWHGDGAGPFAGIHLPKSNRGSFAIGFTIPPDYIPGGELRVRLLWHTASKSCGIELHPYFMSVARAGSTNIIGPDDTTGFAPVGGTSLSAPATSNQSSAHEYVITSPDSHTTLEPDDAIIFGLFRVTDDRLDTCTDDLVIQSIRVAY